MEEKGSEERGPEGREGQPGREGSKGREGVPGIEGKPGATGEVGETGATGEVGETGETGPASVVPGPEGPKGKPGSSISTPIKVVFIIMILIFFLTLAGFSWVVSDVREISRKNAELAMMNLGLIEDIQKSRLETCEKTYTSIRKVFKPFFPPPPRTSKQQEDLDKFNFTINTLKQECPMIIDVPK